MNHEQMQKELQASLKESLEKKQAQPSVEIKFKKGVQPHIGRAGGEQHFVYFAK